MEKTDITEAMRKTNNLSFHSMEANKKHKAKNVSFLLVLVCVSCCLLIYLSNEKFLSGYPTHDTILGPGGMEKHRAEQKPFLVKPAFYQGMWEVMKYLVIGTFGWLSGWTSASLLLPVCANTLPSSIPAVLSAWGSIPSHTWMTCCPTTCGSWFKCCTSFLSDIEGEGPVSKIPLHPQPLLYFSL